MPDLISSVPFDVFYPSNGSDLTRASKTLKLLRLLRLAKLMRLAHISRLLKYVRMAVRRTEDYLKLRISTTAIRFGKLGMVFLTMCHWIASAQWMVVRLYHFPPESWASQAYLVQEEFHVQYWWSLFKSVGTLLNVFGYETMTPIVATSCMSRSEWCSVESWMSLVLLSFGHIFYAVLIAEMNTIISSRNRSRRVFDEQVTEINEYMIAKRLPHSIRDKVRDYFNVRYSTRKIFDEAAILDKLSPYIRKEIMAHNAHDLLRRIPLLCDFPGFANSIATELEAIIHFEGERVCEEGVIGHHFYFVYSGVLQVRSQFRVGKTSGNVMTTLSTGCYFGEVSLLFRQRRLASVYAVSTCILFALSQETFYTALDDFPKVRDRMERCAKLREARMLVMDPVRGKGETAFYFIFMFFIASDICFFYRHNIDACHAYR